MLYHISTRASTNTPTINGLPFFLQKVGGTDRSLLSTAQSLLGQCNATLTSESPDYISQSHSDSQNRVQLLSSLVDLLNKVRTSDAQLKAEDAWLSKMSQLVEALPECKNTQSRIQQAEVRIVFKKIR